MREKYENGILVVSHGLLAESCVASAEMIAGKVNSSRVQTLTLELGEDANEFCKNMTVKSEKLLENNKKLSILTDLIGGTPNNVALRISIDNSRIFVITGYNLMLLIDIFSKLDIDFSIEDLVKTGQSSLKYFEYKIEEKEEDELCL